MPHSSYSARDAAGADGLALLTGLSLEIRKPMPPYNEAMRKPHLGRCTQAPESFNDLEKTTNIALFDLRDLCLGSSQRFVRWAHTQDVIGTLSAG